MPRTLGYDDAFPVFPVFHRRRVEIYESDGKQLAWPDDQQSLVRFLVYSNEYDVEGLVATTSVFLPNRTSKERILEVLDGYGKVRDNLLLHAPDYPSLEYLKSVSKAHLPLLGLEGVGQNKGSEGSRHIIEVVDREDNRPIWITVWVDGIRRIAGANAIAIRWSS